MLDKLNSEQRDGTTYLGGPLMILAGAGTGKTRVITHRIAFLLQQGVPAKLVVALTFTNRAAREMRTRLADLVGETGQGLFCGTFHSYCLLLLRRYHKIAGLDPGFGLIGSADQLELVKKAIEHQGWAGLYRADDLHARISKAKNNLLSPEDLRQGRQGVGTDAEKDPELIAKVYEIYERQLHLNHVIDFDDCILKVVQIATKYPEIREDMTRNCQHLLVDEFQDTNFAQLRVIEMLAAGHKQVCVVGDDDQSIYSWRGAMAETLIRFEELFSGVKIVKLEQNYRCSNVILAAANNVIKNNPARKEKTLWSASKVQQTISLSEHSDEQEEARWIARKCFGFLGNGSKSEDIAILFRTNGQARALEEAFREYKLSYQLVGGTSFFDRKEVRDFLAYLRVIARPSDRLAFFRAIGVPSRGIGLKTFELIDRKTREEKSTPLEVLEGKRVPLKGPTAAAVLEFVNGIRDLQQVVLSTPLDVENLGKAIVKNFHLENELRLKCDDPRARQWKLELLNRLPTWLSNLASYQMKEGAELKLTDLLDKLTLSDDRDRQDPSDGGKITLMTIHGAKGLEWPIVFLCGIEEDILPHRNSQLDERGVSEERRLMYVAMTRAKDRLFLSSCRERSVGFQSDERKASRFLDEIPVECVTRENIDQIGPGEHNPKVNKLQRLSMLKDRIKSGFS